MNATAFDSLDRPAAKYAMQPGSPTTVVTLHNTYDGAPTSLGLLAATTDALLQTTRFSYDERAAITSVTYENDGGVTPPKSSSYDPNGRLASIGNPTFGTTSYQYDPNTLLKEVVEPTNSTLTSAAQVSYRYYPDGSRKDLSVASSLLRQDSLLQHVYRQDGPETKIQLTYGGSSYAFNSTYSDAGRILTRSDPFTGMLIPNPSAPVPAGSVYAPTSWTYDSTGQLSGLQLPFFSYTGITHDHEGNLASYHANTTNGDATTLVSTSIRGENLGTATSVQGGVASTHHDIVHGAVLGPDAGIIDPYNALDVGYSTPADGVGPDGFTIHCPTPNSHTIQYDAARRLISRNTVKNDAQCNVIDQTPRSDGTWSYDADNHSRDTAGTSTGDPIRWGPDGHAYGTSSNGAHYDGNSILFTTFNGALRDINVDDIGYLSLFGPTRFVVSDRDISGSIVSQHNNDGYDGLSVVPAGWSSHCGNGLGLDAGGGGPIGCTTSPVAAIGIPSSQYRTQRAQLFPYTRPDGFDMAGVTIQGVRVYDSASGTWTTPDAYEGNVHDPMSQKAFMWNRNNPYAYSDPSGYESQKGWYDTKSGLPEHVFRDPKVDRAVQLQILDFLVDLIGTGFLLMETGGAGGVRVPYRPYVPRSPLRVNPRSGLPMPEPNAQGPHTQLGTRTSRSQPGTTYPQTREFDKDGNPVYRRDWTSHGRGDHSNPHGHVEGPGQRPGPPERLNPDGTKPL